jgi:hypothetical protein
MTPRTITLLCLPLAAAGAGFAVHATVRVRADEQELAALAETGRAAGESFVSTLQGEHAERQRAVFDRRREVAIRIAAARRNRILGVLGVAGAGLLAAALSALSRISREIDADRRHLQAQGAYRRPDRS